MLINERQYSTVMGSDIKRDGMFLELNAGEEPTGKPLAEWFYSDGDGALSLTVYEAGIPSAALAWFEAEAARRLPPSPRAG